MQMIRLIYFLREKILILELYLVKMLERQYQIKCKMKYKKYIYSFKFDT